MLKLKQKTLFGPKIISSISFNQNEIINDIIDLHCGVPIELDPTYSLGVFYKKGIPEPKLRFDIDPQVSGVKMADCRNLPIDNGVINTMIFDPPFISSRDDGRGIIGKRFSSFKSICELWEFYKDSLMEFYRILGHKGVLIFKCQDVVDSGNHFSHVQIMNDAESIGFRIIDLFILLAKSRIIYMNGGIQHHARKFHSYFWVFRK